MTMAPANMLLAPEVAITYVVTPSTVPMPGVGGLPNGTINVGVLYSYR
jgi:hypothetical protein